MSERFYCPELGQGAANVTLEGDEARHLAKARRVAAGEFVELFDGQGFASLAEVVNVSPRSVTLRPEGPPLRDRRPEISLTLATAVPKGDRFDWLVEKATELGVERLIPLATERSVVDPRSSKLERLRRAVIEACKQCGRNRLMTIEEPRTWTEFISEAPREGRRLVGHPTGVGFGAWTRGLAPALVAIGPEGGFSNREIAEAVALGWQAIGLGPTLLRIETAAIVAASRVLALGEAVGDQVHCPPDLSS